MLHQLFVLPPLLSVDCCGVIYCCASGNRWEAALYGSLCGHLSRVLPVCSSWEDEAWAYCR